MHVIATLTNSMHVVVYNMLSGHAAKLYACLHTRTRPATGDEWAVIVKMTSSINYKPYVSVT